MRGRINENVGSDKFKDQFEFLIENSLVGVCIIQKNKTKFANRFLLETLGYTLEELKNVNFWEIIAPEDRDRIKENKINREKGEKSPDLYQIKVVKKDGEIFDAELRDTRITYNGLPAVMCVVIDVSKREKANKKFSALQVRISLLAHEIKNPLQSISSAADQLRLKEREKLEREDIELLDLIREQSEKLNNLLRDFLIHQKCEYSTLTLVNGEQASGEGAETLRDEVKSRNIILDENPDQDLGEIKTDPKRIR